MFKQTFIWQNKLKQMKTRGEKKERILSFNSAYQQKLMSTGKKLHERQKQPQKSKQTKILKTVLKSSKFLFATFHDTNDSG